MKKHTIASAAATPAIGPYSPALAVGDFLFISGQVPIDSEGEIVGITAADQTRQALENMTAHLSEAGLGVEDVVKTTIFLTDMGEFASVNEVYAEFFTPPYPARSTVQVAALPKSVSIEIEAIALRG
jgi:2-iminobutanoate/2-iminopropanoate deaminase